MNKSYNRIIDVLIEVRIDQINEAGRFRKAIAGAVLGACIGPSCKPPPKEPVKPATPEIHTQQQQGVTTDSAIATLKRMWANQDATRAKAAGVPRVPVGTLHKSGQRTPPIR
jgi:hypothetical protein